MNDYIADLYLARKLEREEEQQEKEDARKKRRKSSDRSDSQKE